MEALVFIIAVLLVIGHSLYKDYQASQATKLSNLKHSQQTEERKTYITFNERLTKLGVLNTPLTTPTKTGKQKSFNWPSIQKDTIDYQQYICSKEWNQSKARLTTLSNDNYSCRMCNNSETLEVHHITYANLGNETINDLCTLCSKCHNYTHLMAGNGAKYYPPIKHPSTPNSSSSPSVT